MNIDLEKRVHKVTVELAKHNILKAPTLRVGLSLDISGSTSHLYKNGIIQQVVDRLLALAIKFDDDGSMDMWAFSNDFSRLKPATADVFNGYVDREIMNNSSINKWSGTSYAPVMGDVVNMYFNEADDAPAAAAGGFFKSLLAFFMGPPPSSAPSQAGAVVAEEGDPVLNLFVTDGDNNDKDATAKLLRAAAKDHKVYWQMVGVGSPDEFAFIESMAKELPNVGFVNLSSLKMGEDELYSRIITAKLCNWVSAL